MAEPIVLAAGAYGSRAEPTLVADFFELRATSRPLPYRNMVDFINDTGIRPSRHQSVPLHSFPFDEEDIDGNSSPASTHAVATEHRIQEAREEASRVVRVLRERAQSLGRNYPFELDAADGLRRRSRRKACAYDVALTMTLRHACLGDPEVANEFEEFVWRCLRTRDWAVYALGPQLRKTPGKGHPRFKAVFDDLQRRLVVSERSAGQVPEAVNDHGADLVLRWPPLDSRSGKSTVLVQATVGKCESWAKKASETPLHDWSEFLGDPLHPTVYLAVPHHIEEDHLMWFVRNYSTAVLDRLRLVAHEPGITKAEIKRAQRVLDQGVEE